MYSWMTKRTRKHRPGAPSGMSVSTSHTHTHSCVVLSSRRWSRWCDVTQCAADAIIQIFTRLPEPYSLSRRPPTVQSCLQNNLHWHSLIRPSVVRELLIVQILGLTAGSRAGKSLNCITKALSAWSAKQGLWNGTVSVVRNTCVTAIAIGGLTVAQ